ncbi:MAG: outer membrane protein transport protein [Verrucomicrobia bacterium]|nr:outer membrane protein transport protein [Verrucomicrobiota bacterium]
MRVTAEKQTLLTLFVLFIFAQGSLLADGFRNLPEGASAIGAFGGHRAFADDANATIHNSANLVDLEQPMVQINTVVGYGQNKFQAVGFADKTDNPWFLIPGFSVAAPLQDGKYAIGFATYVPFGRSVDWGDDGFFANNNISYAGSMTVFDFTPNVAMRLTDSLSIGVGADIYYGEVEQKTMFTGLTAAFLGLPSGTKSTLTGDGTALGWNAALTWKMTDRQRLSATYRSPFTIKYTGDNEYSIGGTRFLERDVSAKIEYPTIVGLAYGVEFTDTLRAELDFEWLEFSQYKNLVINEGGGSTTIPQKLKDTWTIGVGGEWDFATNWTARTGFMYLRNPTPNDTYGPLGPDDNQAVISFGLGYENEKHAVDIGYAAGLFDGRSISGSVNSPDGHYDYLIHVVSLSYGYKF